MRFAFICFSLLIITHSAFAADPCRDAIPSRIYYQGPGVQTKVTDPAVLALFVQVYDMMPVQLHPLFCSFSRFTLQQPYDASADSGMHFRAGLFKNNLDAGHWQTWKEQLNFGMLNNDLFSTVNTLPLVSVIVNNKPVSFLYPVLVHELGHNVARSFNFESRWNKRHATGAAILPEAAHFCVYWCNGNALSPSLAEEIYSRVYTKTDWVTLYSRISEEDFADSFAYYVLIHWTAPNSDYQIQTPGGAKYSLRELMATPLYKEKLDLLAEAFRSLPKQVVKLDESRKVLYIQ